MSYSDSDDDYEPLDLTVEGFHSTGTQGWGTLLDPQIKIDASCGQLHRQGRNFRPIDEQLIVDRRLGKPLPPGGLNGPKKKKKRSKAKKKQEQQQPQTQIPVKTPVKPSVDKPQPQLNKAAAGKQKGKKKNEPKLVAPSKPRPNLDTHAWSTNQLMETPFWETPNGSAASRYADPPVERPQVTQQGNHAPQHQSNYYDMQHTVNQPTNQYTPCIIFTIELAPGVSVKLTVYENDDPMNVVHKFETQHQLTMSAEAKHRFAQRVAILLTKFHAH